MFRTSRFLSCLIRLGGPGPLDRLSRAEQHTAAGFSARTVRAPVLYGPPPPTPMPMAMKEPLELELLRPVIHSRIRRQNYGWPMLLGGNFFCQRINHRSGMPTGPLFRVRKRGRAALTKSTPLLRCSLGSGDLLQSSGDLMDFFISFYNISH